MSILIIPIAVAVTVVVRGLTRFWHDLFSAFDSCPNFDHARLQNPEDRRASINLTVFGIFNTYL